MQRKPMFVATVIACALVIHMQRGTVDANPQMKNSSGRVADERSINYVSSAVEEKSTLKQRVSGGEAERSPEATISEVSGDQSPSRELSSYKQREESTTHAVLAQSDPERAETTLADGPGASDPSTAPTANQNKWWAIIESGCDVTEVISKAQERSQSRDPKECVYHSAGATLSVSPSWPEGSRLDADQSRAASSQPQAKSPPNCVIDQEASDGAIVRDLESHMSDAEVKAGGVTYQVDIDNRSS